MTKGSYTVGEGSNNPQRHDNSYKSFICALLVFLAICLIVFLAVFNWKSLSDKGTKEEKQSEDVEVFEKFEGSDKSTTRKANIIVLTAPEISTTLRSVISRISTTRARSTTTPTQGNKKFDDYPATSAKQEIEDFDVSDQNESTTLSSTGTTNSTETPTRTITSKAINHTETSSRTTTSKTINYFPTTRDQQDLEDFGDYDVVSTTHVTSSSEAANSTQALTFTESSPVRQTRNQSLTEEVQVEPTTSEIFTETTTSTIEIILEQTMKAIAEKSNVTFTNFRNQSSSEEVEVESTTPEITTDLITTETILEKIVKRTPGKPDVVSTTQRSTTPLTTKAIAASLNSTTQKATTEDEISIFEQETETTTRPKNTTKTSPPPRSAIIFGNSDPVCRSSVCNTAASRILSMMNHSASPCEDFYEFACGGAWEESAESDDVDILSTYLSDDNNNLPKYFMDLKDFYTSCTEYENDFRYSQRIEQVRDLLSEVGKFEFENTTYDITEFFAKLILRQSMPLFDVGIDVDKQSSNLILQLTLPQTSSLKIGLDSWSALSLNKERCLKKQRAEIRGSFLNLNKIYDSYVDCQKDYASYLNSVENVVRELGVFSNLTSQDLLKEIKDIRFSIEFEVLDQLSRLPSQIELLKQHLEKQYDIRKISDLQAQYPILQWKELFKTLTGHDIQDNTLVQVYFGSYFTEMFNALGRVERRKLKNAFLAIYANDLFLNVVVTHERKNRESFCIDLTKKLLPDIWANLIKTSFSPEEEKYQDEVMTKLFTTLKSKFCKSLQEAEWIEDSLKVAVIKKCNNLNLGLFTELDKWALIKNYEQLNITDNYPRNLIDLLINSRLVVYSNEGQPFTVQRAFSYFLEPRGTRPLTLYSNGMIVAPIGLIRKLPSGLPEYLKMTRIGLHLAREIARHFDPTGIKYGVKLTSYSKETYEDLISKTESMMDYSSPRLFQHHNISFKTKTPLLSTNEKIAENAAFRLVLDSFDSIENQELLPWISASYSREKIFFIAAAQEYCKKISVLGFMMQVFEGSSLPPTLQVENIMGNSQRFLEKFSCPEGSGMDRYVEKLQFPYMSTVASDYDYPTISD